LEEAAVALMPIASCYRALPAPIEQGVIARPIGLASMEFVSNTVSFVEENLLKTRLV
jgi:hypothetical protein